MPTKSAPLVQADPTSAEDEDEDEAESRKIAQEPFLLSDTF
jgi:hypothetical protein